MKRIAGFRTGSAVGNQSRPDMAGAMGKPSDGVKKSVVGPASLHDGIAELKSQHPYHCMDIDPHHDDKNFVRMSRLGGMEPSKGGYGKK